MKRLHVECFANRFDGANVNYRVRNIWHDRRKTQQLYSDIYSVMSVVVPQRCLLFTVDPAAGEYIQRVSDDRLAYRK